MEVRSANGEPVASSTVTGGEATRATRSADRVTSHEAPADSSIVALGWALELIGYYSSIKRINVINISKLTCDSCVIYFIKQSVVKVIII